MITVGGNEKPQRRIIIENEALLQLFDVLHAGISEQKDGPPISIEFEEGKQDLEEILGVLVAEVVDKIALAPFFNLILDSKTFEVMVEKELVSKTFSRFVRDNMENMEDTFLDTIEHLLIEAVIGLVDNLLKEAELFNLKKIKIKTRRHVIAIC